MTDQKFDILTRQENTFQASVENAKIANEAVKSSQNWQLILGLAELSFLGAIILDDSIEKTCMLCFVKLLIIILLISFLLFIIASVLQYKHVLKRARIYEKISHRAIQYLNMGKRYVEEMPNDLALPEKQIVSSDITNYMFFISLLFVTIATLGIIVLIILL